MEEYEFDYNNNKLGCGTYGTVYKIKYNETMNVAGKILRNNEKGLSELGEVNILHKFKHPNILKCINIDIKNKSICVYLPLASGNLTKILPETNLKIRTQWVNELISGIHFMHSNGYYHNDIKPSNILIIDNKSVIADFSLSGHIISGDIDDCQTIMCKNPQQLYKHKPKWFDEKSIPLLEKTYTNIQTDMWALGCTIYYIAHIDYPFFTKKYHFRKKVFKQYLDTKTLQKESKFDNIIKSLLNPNPEELNFKFLGKNYIFIDGVINNQIPNEKSVIFSPEIKEDFKNIFTWVFTIAKQKKIIDIVIYNTIDLYYRSYEIFNIGEDLEICIFTCMFIACKVYNNNSFLLKRFNAEHVFEIEKRIVKYLKGILDRELLVYYNVPIEKFKKWILENPEKYELFTTLELSREIDKITQKDN